MLIRLRNVAINSSMFSSGSARTSSVASASAGITFSRKPPRTIVGTTEVRSIELYKILPARSFSCWCAAPGARGLKQCKELGACLQPGNPLIAPIRPSRWPSIQARSIQRFDPDVFVVHRAVRVVGLKRDRPGPDDLAAGAFGPSGPVRRLCPLHHLFAVHMDADGVALDDDVLGEPLVVLRRRLVGNVAHVIQAAGSDPVGVRVVHLYLKAFRREVSGGADSAADLLKLGQHVDAAIRTGARHYVHFQLEISEAVVAKAAVIITVARRAIGDDGPVLEREGRSRTADLPACEVLAVEQTGPAGLVLSKANRSVLSEDGRTPDDCGHGDQKHEFASPTHLFLPSGRAVYYAARAPALDLLDRGRKL